MAKKTKIWKRKKRLNQTAYATNCVRYGTDLGRFRQGGVAVVDKWKSEGSSVKGR